MEIIIVGGGKIGYYLIKTLLPQKHIITVIEQQESLCRKIANELNVSVIKGDGTSIDILSQIDTKNVDVFIAVTGRDEENLIACQLAKRNLHINNTIARINNPKNVEVFKKLGVDKTVCSTSGIAEMIEHEINLSGIKTLTRLEKGNQVISEIKMTEKSSVCGKMLKDIKKPKECLVISIIRGEQSIIPTGYTVIRENDFILTVSSIDDRDELYEFFLG